MDKIGEYLKSTINTEGIEYLQRDPFKVYQGLISVGVDSSRARLVLTTLLAGAVDKARGMDEGTLSKALQRDCFLLKKAADNMASLYKNLFSTENIASWKEKENSGFEEFCDTIWEFEWDASGQWGDRGGHYDCEASVTADIEVEDEELVLAAVSGLLEKNPFTSAEDICSFLVEKLDGALDADFEEYISSDDYYPPVMEDYHHNAEYELEKCCKTLGLKVSEFECSGDMSDFESDYHRW